MEHLRNSLKMLLKSLRFLIVNFFRFLGRLFFLDLWRDPTARPVLFYAFAIILLGTFLFHWLEKWDYLDSLYFVIITLTTIGFGDYSPTTPISKVLTIFFGINGIVLLLVLFDLIRRVRQRQFQTQVKQLAQSDGPMMRKMADATTQGVTNAPEPTPVQPAMPKVREMIGGFRIVRNTLTKLFLIDLVMDPQSRGVLIYAGIVILIGGFAFQSVEHWSLFNSVYFMVITMTTIGYGDFTPSLDLGKLLTIFFGLNGIVVLLSLYDRIRAVRGQK